VHSEQFSFVRGLRAEHPSYFSGTEVIEIGSLNINGSIRELFHQPRYLGVDLAPGPCVDYVSRGEDVDVNVGLWDVVASCECFEHNRNWRETWRRMVELARPGGLVFFTCATTGRGEHGTSRSDPSASPHTNDYYCNLTEADFRAVCNFDETFAVYEFSVEPNHHDLFFWGLKHGNVLGGRVGE